MKLRSHTRTSPPRSKFTTRYATTECSSEASCSYQDYGSEVEMDREKQRDQQEVDMFQEFEMYQQAMDEETMEYECAISGAEEVAMIQQEILHDEEMIWQEHLQNNVEEMEEMFEQQISGYGDSIWQDWTDTTAANIPSSIQKPIAWTLDTPPIFYRVYDNYPVSGYHPSGFTARNLVLPTTPLEFRKMVTNHINWNARDIKTPFISMTSCLKEVDRYVDRRVREAKNRDIRVAVIDARALLIDCKAEIWRIHDALGYYGICPPDYFRMSDLDHGFICALRVPSAAIIGCWPARYLREA